MYWRGPFCSFIASVDRTSHSSFSLTPVLRYSLKKAIPSFLLTSKKTSPDISIFLESLAKSELYVSRLPTFNHTIDPQLSILLQAELADLGVTDGDGARPYSNSKARTGGGLLFEIVYCVDEHGTKFTYTYILNRHYGFLFSRILDKWMKKENYREEAG